MNSISQHANPSRSQWPMLRDRGWLASAQSLGDSLRYPAKIYVAGHGGAGYFFSRVISCLHAVFVEFCSEKRSQPITALFLVQISCSWRHEELIVTFFQTGAALETIFSKLIFKVGSSRLFLYSFIERAFKLNSKPRPGLT